MCVRSFWDRCYLELQRINLGLWLDLYVLRFYESRPVEIAGTPVQNTEAAALQDVYALVK